MMRSRQSRWKVQMRFRPRSRLAAQVYPMITSSRLDWRSPVAMGIAVMALGSGVMGPLWALTYETPGIPGWTSFTGTTVGDTLLLPVLAASLLAAFRYFPTTETRRETLVLAGGAFIGTVGGMALQLSWILDDRPMLSWLLPHVHHFSPLGYYHAIFLCIVSGILFSLAFGTVYRIRHNNDISADQLNRVAASPLLFVILACIWAFSVLTIQGGGAGISNLATVASVILPSLLVIVLCLYALRGRWIVTLQTMFWALLFASLLCLLIILWPVNLDTPVALIVALGLTGAISFRDPGYRYRIVESCIIGVAVACLIVLPLGDPNTLVRNTLLSLCIAPVVVALTAAGPLVDRPLVTRCSWTDVGIMSLFAVSIPIVAWLLRNGVSDVGAGSFVVALAAPIVGERIVPWYQSEMERITTSEEDHLGVTFDPGLTSLARLVAFRGVSLGIAAIAVLLGIVVSAGPSMGFVHGNGMPDLNLGLTLAALPAALGLVTIAVFVRRSILAPVAVVAGSLTVFGIALTDFTEAHYHSWWSVWVGVAAALVILWQLESIIANAAMRPRWLVRREWRHVLATSAALAVGMLTLLTCTEGMLNSSGSPADPLASLLVFAGGVLTGWMIVVGAGWALDWQPKLIADGYAITTGEDTGEPNWAGYRLRSCLLMDFGLIQGLTAIGIWLPSLALVHIGLSSPNRFFNTAVMALTGMLLFVPTFIWSLHNSVRHVDGQSRKAKRPPRSLFYGTLPYVSLREERQVIQSLLRSPEGPVDQKAWARALASHQLHLNLIALTVAVVSFGGTVGILIYISRNASGARIPRIEESATSPKALV